MYVLFVCMYGEEEKATAGRVRSAQQAGLQPAGAGPGIHHRIAA